MPNDATNGNLAAGTRENTRPEQYSEFRRVVRVFLGRKIAVVGMVIILLLILTAILAPFLTQYDPIKTDILHKLLPPSSEHLLGTDSLGRDTLCRIIYGTRTSLLIGVGAV
jgi:peptide/nickel transport system permease protein